MQGELRDPVKEVQALLAKDKRLAGRKRTRAALCAHQGQDWKTIARQLREEKALMKKLGLTVLASPTSRPHGKRSKA